MLNENKENNNTAFEILNIWEIKFGGKYLSK